MAVACAGNANADATLLQPSHTRTQQASGHPKQFCQEGMGTAAPKSILHVVRALPYVTLTPPPHERAAQNCSRQDAASRIVTRPTYAAGARAYRPGQHELSHPSV